MDILENITVGVTIVLVTSLIAYLYHIRQLYATSPVLFQKVPDDVKKGIAQVIVFNRGNQVEENVEVELDPSVTARMAAANLPGITLDGSVIHIERIQKKQAVNLLLWTEEKGFDSSKILSVSSNDTNGKVCRTEKDIPFNYGLTALAIAVLIGLFPLLYYGYQLAHYVEQKMDEENMEPVVRQGWRHLDAYRTSDLRKSYSDREFPVRLSGVRKKNDYANGSIPSGLKEEWDKLDERNDLLLDYEVNNKTATDLGVLAFNKNRADVPYYVGVSPLAQGTLVIPVRPAPGSDSVDVEFVFRMNDEWLDRIEHSVPVPQPVVSPESTR